jgi:glycosyltransferase involved in cell wall biosynthesis
MKKKKILFLSDDMRMFSGVAVMSKELIMGTVDKYDWVQLGAAVKHPEEGKKIDMSDAIKDLTGIKDASVFIYPTSGYGNPQILRELINLEKPDAILHFTDPRQWIWLYEMEHEIRTKIPIMYYNIWDDLPDPHYNRDYYRSSDLLMSISKQTYGINKRVMDGYDYKDWQFQYVPHGIDHKKFYSVDKNDTKFKKFESKYGLDGYKFKVLYLNRNIRRKNPGDVLLAYKHFIDSLPETKKDECCMVFHTAPTDEHGTDLRAFHKALLKDCNVIFTLDKHNAALNEEEMNFIYNSVDVYINLASNEGFGLGSAEALMTETPIIVNVTGGLQDQCGFTKTEWTEDEDGNKSNPKKTYLTAGDYVELGSNHRGQYKEHGDWVKPVFPSNISCQGSPLTPYIFDDRVQYEDAGDAIKYWYDLGGEKRKLFGKNGRKYVTDTNINMTAENMCKRMVESVEQMFDKWEPKSNFILELV